MSGLQAKELLTLYYGVPRYKLSCRMSRRFWQRLIINLGGHSITTEQKREFEKECMEAGICGRSKSNDTPQCVWVADIVWHNYAVTDGSGKALIDMRDRHAQP